MDDLRTRLGQATATVVGLLGEVADTGVLPRSTDDGVLDWVDTVETLGRAVDALRVMGAGEVAYRSRKILGDQGLAYRLGCGSTTELLERTARVLPVTARARVRLGERTRPDSAVSGGVVAAEFDEVAFGLVSGRLGVDAAAEITTALTRVKPRLQPGVRFRLVQAEHELVCAAIGAGPEPGVAALPPVTPAETSMQASVWVERLDPDGARPAGQVFASRAFHVHRARPDGLVPVSGVLLPETAGMVRRVFDTLTNPRQSVKFLTDEQRAAMEGSDGPADPRSRAQRQHDAIATVFDIAGRSDQLPTLGGASATMIVSVLATDFDAGVGAGHVDGIDALIPMDALEQHACTNGIQRVTLSPAGRILRIGTRERCFNRAQRRALAVRDGGCVIPGCHTPAWACEAHHVTPWETCERTHTDNGVLLCWYHHRTIETSGWRIRMINGHPETMPPPHLGPRHWTPHPGSRLRQSSTLKRRLDTDTR